MRSIFFTSFLLGCLLGAATAMAQPDIAWDKTLGGEGYEEFNALCPMSDCIYMCGSSPSNIAFGNPADNSYNFLIFKTDLNGNLLWQKMFGGDQTERLWAFTPTADGAFIAGGYSESGINGDKTQASRGGKDVWLVKLDANGKKIWDRTLGGAGDDELFSIVELPDGDLLLGCNSNSNVSGEKSEPSRGGLDFWIVRTDAQGNKLWDKTLGGNGDDRINDIVSAKDGNFFLSGGTISLSDNGDLGPAPARGGVDFWLVKLDANAPKILWQKRFGGTAEDFPYALCEANSGNLWMGGRSGSLPAPPTAYNNGKDAAFLGGDSDYWLLELDADGEKLRDMSFGGAGLDDLYAIQEHECGGFTLGGVSASAISGNKITPPRGGYDFWLIGLDESGSQIWQHTLGGVEHDAFTKMACFPDGSWIFGGHSASGAGFEKTQASLGFNDFWVLKTPCFLPANIFEKSDTLHCLTNALVLDATAQNCPGCSYQWNTGNTAPIQMVPPGTTDYFSVKICDPDLCVSRDTLFVAFGQQPRIELGPADTLILQGDVLVLAGNNSNLEYQWNTGSTSSSLPVVAPGNYAVTVTDPSGCTASDAILVSIKGAQRVYVPNVFSPNDDGQNDWVTVFGDEGVQTVLTFQIFDRWGNLVFKQDRFTPNQERLGWDGYCKGEIADMNVYTWFARVEYLDGTDEIFKGDLTILR